VTTRTRSRVYSTLLDVIPHVRPESAIKAQLDLPTLTAQTEQQVTELLDSPNFDAWSEAPARVGNCAHPIRLRGRSERVDTTTGEIVATYSSEQEPLGVTHAGVVPRPRPRATC
jgi:hypothetical protein